MKIVVKTAMDVWRKTNIHQYLNNTFHEFKVLKKVIKTEIFYIDFHNEFIKFGLFYFSYFSSYCRI